MGVRNSEKPMENGKYSNAKKLASLARFDTGKPQHPVPREIRRSVSPKLSINSIATPKKTNLNSAILKDDLLEKKNTQPIR